MNGSIRWGIMGTGRAAIEFSRGLRFAHGAELTAVGSRSAETAAEFARRFGTVKAWPSYDELVRDPSIDVVYIATPHTSHKDHCLLALGAGKAVLCEKPFTATANEAQQVIAYARHQKLFCMEAMWMHFLPAMQKAIELIRAGAIGEPRIISADFGVPAIFDPKGRVFNAALGGGALMDRGVYPLALAWRLFGGPSNIEAMSTSTSSNVDEHSAVLLKYPGGQMAMLAATLSAYAANEAVVMGTEGRITIHEPLCRPDRLTISRAPMPTSDAAWAARTGLKDRLRSNPMLRRLRHILPKRAKTMYVPYVGNGYNYEASEVGRCLNAGAIESPVWSLDQTAGVMQSVDLIRNRLSA
jgi:predicted dehydrogenase